MLLNRGVQIGMDSVGAYMDNIFNRTTVEEREMRGGVSKRIRECGRGQSRDWSLPNNERPHQALERRTPAQVSEEGRSLIHRTEVIVTSKLVPV